MKLRNKKTGKIVDCAVYCNGTFYNSVNDVFEEWEDYEEPKGHWYIDCDGEVYESVRLNQFDLDRMANIGNYFETREEAEKIVEKLKAWKRLKDCGFKFVGWKRDERYSGDYHIEAEDYDKCDDKDLDLLFGGKNDSRC